MERTFDYSKRNLLFVVGQPLNLLPELGTEERNFRSARELLARHTAKDLEDHYLLLHFAREEEAGEAAAELIARGVTHDQLFVLGAAPMTGRPLAVIPLAKDECADDLRLRISVQVELVRQRRLDEEVSAATNNGALVFFHTLHGSKETVALDRARFAHALACALLLGPSRHARSVRLALFYELPEQDGWRECLKSVRHLWPLAGLLEARAALTAADENQPWPADLPIELLIAECADLAAKNTDSAIRFRELFREKCAKLPFRLRADLRDAAERCFAHVWQGGSHAA